MSSVVPKKQKADVSTHAALEGLGVLGIERESSAVDVLRRIVQWRDGVDSGVVRGADLERLIVEARTLLQGVKASTGGTE